MGTEVCLIKGMSGFFLLTAAIWSRDSLPEKSQRGSDRFYKRHKIICIEQRTRDLGRFGSFCSLGPLLRNQPKQIGLEQEKKSQYATVRSQLQLKEASGAEEKRAFFYITVARDTLH
jgi:hypothetical protein